MFFSVDMVAELLADTYGPVKHKGDRGFSLNKAAYLSDAPKCDAGTTVFVSRRGDGEAGSYAKELCCVFVNTQEAPESCDACIWIEAGVSPEDVLYVLQKFFLDAANLENEMLSATLSLAEPQEILELCLRSLDDSFVTVYDATYKIIATTDSRIHSERKDIHSFIGKEAYLNFWYLDDTKQYSRAKQEYGLRFEDIFSHNARVVDNPSGSGKVISCGVFRNGVWYMRIWVEEKAGNVKRRYLPVVDSLAKCIYARIVNEKGYNILDDAPFRDMLSGKNENLLLLHYLKALNWENSDRYVMYVFSGKRLNEPLYRFDRASTQQLARLIPGAQVINMTQSLVCVVNESKCVQLSENTEKIIKSFALQNKLLCAESPRFFSFDYVADYYSRAITALSLGMFMEPGNVVYHVDNYLSASAFFEYMHGRNADTQLHSAAIRLDRCDKKYNSSLAETLFVYLLNDKSHARCSDILGISRRTFQYRLSKALELAEVDIDNGVDRLNLLNSLLFLRIRDKME